jgi:hypothetical protein
VASTISRNTILPDGSILGLALRAGDELSVRNNPLPVTAFYYATFDPASKLEFIMDADWTSPVGFDEALTPSLGGTLDLEFADGVDPSTLVGDTFQLFHWSGPLPAGDQFSAINTAPGLSWDLSNLYTTGAVTLNAVPEPSTFAMVAIGLSVAPIAARRRLRLTW